LLSIAYDACLFAFDKAIRDSHLVGLSELQLSECQFSALGGVGMLLGRMAEHSAQLPRLRTLIWWGREANVRSIVHGLQRGACPRLKQLDLNYCKIDQRTMTALCGALTVEPANIVSFVRRLLARFGALTVERGAAAPCAQTLECLTLNSTALRSRIWTILCNSLVNPNFAPKLRRLDLMGHTFSPEIRLQFQAALQTRREKMGAAFCLNEVII
jgi:hypothetical protein